MVIIANGDLVQTDRILSLIHQADMVIAADGGAVHLYRMKLIPGIIIGDLDSVPPKILSLFKNKQVQILKHPTRKDQTDMELCIEYAAAHRCTDLHILGATSSRLDHTLANIFLLRKIEAHNMTATISDNRNDIHLVTGSLDLDGHPGDLLSVIPASDRVTGLTLEGLEYPLTDKTLFMGSSLGISNVFRENRARVAIQSGAVLVIRPMD